MWTLTPARFARVGMTALGAHEVAVEAVKGAGGTATKAWAHVALPAMNMIAFENLMLTEPVIS